MAHKKLSGGVISSIVIGTLCAIFVIVVLVFTLNRRKHNRQFAAESARTEKRRSEIIDQNGAKIVTYRMSQRMSKQAGELKAEEIKKHLAARVGVEEIESVSSEDGR
jgi:hypothetical protein